MNWSFEWDQGHGEVQSLAAMLGPVWFKLSSGRVVQPFAVAPWSDDGTDEHADLPPILKKLRGEWPCVPFGMPEARTDLPAGWLDGLDPDLPPLDEHIHGYSSNHDWQLVGKTADSITLEINYPDDHSVSRLTRTISGQPGEPRINLSLKVEVRRKISLPMGIHPVFALPATAGDAVLEFSSLESVRTYPVDTETGVSVLEPDQQVPSLGHLKAKNGTILDASRLPLPHPTEELLLVDGHVGQATLRHADPEYSVELSWDPEVFPSCLIWVSNRGRADYPWNGRFNAVGIEPVNAAFDLGSVHSLNEQNPLSRSGLKTSHDLSPQEPLETSYSIALAES